VKLTTIYLDEEENKPLVETNSCGSVEGLATFVAMMKRRGRENEPIAQRALEHIERLMAVNRQLQINESLAVKLSVDEKYLSRLDEYRGAFILSVEEPLMQVDLTQHCLNALLRMH
jgi:hypothetical protein